jgi:rfaE bifunctional protein nucleotidyltransferase chain/domain
VEADGPHGALARAEALHDRWNARWVCVTRGADGAVAIGDEGPALAFAAPPAGAGDPCGAGDRFASRAAEILAAGGDVPDAIRTAVASASAFVAAGGAAATDLAALAGDAAPRHAAAGHPGAASPYPGAAPLGTAADHPGAALLRPGAASLGTGADYPGAAPPHPDAAPPRVAADHPAVPLAGELDVVARVRAEGGTVVATGGCFDLLHPGHVRTLQAARGLGDCLVVCLNSDASMRALKGPGRPVVNQEDRAAVLLALGCVDAVVIFDEETPIAALERLRPDLWVKGGDYAQREVPEAATLAAWGGRAVVLPYLEGRSTTRLIKEAALHAV